jgi:hypothetical protein
MRLDVSVILPLRDMERLAAPMVRSAAELVTTLPGPDLDDSAEPTSREPRYEVLALDESSGDNTLSVLSVLHGQVEQLRTLQDVEPGMAIGQASQVARGEAWLVFDRPIDLELGLWGLRQIFRGHRAAIVRGEVLAVSRDVGAAALTGLQGGLVTAQRCVRQYLHRHGEHAALSPGPDRGLADRASLYVRGRLAPLGLGWLDRPLRRRSSLRLGGLL